MDGDVSEQRKKDQLTCRAAGGQNPEDQSALLDKPSFGNGGPENHRYHAGSSSNQKPPENHHLPRGSHQRGQGDSNSKDQQRKANCPPKTKSLHDSDRKGT